MGFVMVDQENRWRNMFLPWICPGLMEFASLLVRLAAWNQNHSIEDPSRDGERLHYDLSRNEQLYWSQMALSSLACVLLDVAN